MFIYAKYCNLIGWIMEHGLSIHFRIDGPDRLYGTSSQSKHGFWGKLERNLSTEDSKKVSYFRKIVGEFF